MELLEIFRKCNCCISGRPLADCKSMNVLQTEYVATWNYPIMSNLLIPGDYKHAVAYIHDDYMPDDGILKEPIKFVIEFRGDEIIYHPVESLQKGPSFTDPTNKPSLS